MKIENNLSFRDDLIEKYKLDAILTPEMIVNTEVVRFEQDEYVLTANEPMRHFYFFISGKLKVFQIHENGRALLLQFYSKFDSLGEVEFMNNLPNTCSVVAVKHSLLLRIPFETMDLYAKNHPPFLQYVIRSLSSKLMAADKHHAYNLLYPTKNRLSSYLKAHLNDSDTILLMDSMQEISDFIGTTYRQLHRAFKQLQDSRVIEKKGKQIKVIDHLALDSLAGKLYDD
jgi:CRP-like cAMP-binding protein